MIKNRQITTLIEIVLVLIFANFPRFANAQEGSATFPSILPGLPDISSGVQFCNKSTGDSHIWVAINHFENGKWFREGWWKIPFNDCKTVLSTIRNRYIYYHAYSEKHIWQGGKHFCTQSSAFKIEPGSCEDEERRGFKELDLKDSKSFRMTLN